MFDQQLAFGKAAESSIARWLIGRGCSVLPVYEKIINDGKGPQVFTPSGDVIAPDLFVYKIAGGSGVDATEDCSLMQYIPGVCLQVHLVREGLFSSE